MCKNLIPMVATELGLADGDEFEIIGFAYNPCKYEDGELTDCDGDRITPRRFVDILYGVTEIKKIPWKPKDGETVFYVSSKYDGISWFIYHSDNAFHISLHAFGNCFRTQAEAEAGKDEMLAKIDEWR